MVAVPRKAESDCRRTKSKEKPVWPFNSKVVAVPVEGVKTMEVGTTLKLMSPKVDGGVSATMTKLTLAVLPPPPPFPLGRPLHESKTRHATRLRKTKDL